MSAKKVLEMPLRRLRKAGDLLPVYETMSRAEALRRNAIGRWTVEGWIGWLWFAD